MSGLSFAKVTALPTTLTPDTVYFKVVDASNLEIYVSDATGQTTRKAGGTAGSTSYINSFFSGTLAVMTGTVKWYPPAPITISNIELFVSTDSVGAGITISLNKNGASTGTYTLAANTGYVSTAIALSLIVGDYLTIDITSVGSTTPGSDLQVRLSY